MRKKIGIVPARMKSSRFPGKPLFPICGKPMIEHVYARALKVKSLSHLALATCDREIEDFGISHQWKVVMTSDKHTRCLDRIAEATPKICPDVKDSDIVICIQGDEPLMHPDMVDKVIATIENNPEVECTVLAMDINSEEEFKNKDVVKIVHDLKGDVLYTSRSPIPFCEKFTKDVGAKRIYGILAFTWGFLKKYNSLPESPLEIVESCDSNRIMDNGLKERVTMYKYLPSFAVDSPSDIGKVEKVMKDDPFWGSY